MKFAYDQPLLLVSAPRPELKVESIKHGVTEIHISDGRILRLSFHVEKVAQTAGDINGVDVAYSVVSELLAKPAVPIADVHETVQ